MGKRISEREKTGAVRRIWHVPRGAHAGLSWTERPFSWDWDDEIASPWSWWLISCGYACTYAKASRNIRRGEIFLLFFFFLLCFLWVYLINKVTRIIVGQRGKENDMRRFFKKCAILGQHDTGIYPIGSPVVKTSQISLNNQTRVDLIGQESRSWRKTVVMYRLNFFSFLFLFFFWGIITYLLSFFLLANYTFCTASLS